MAPHTFTQGITGAILLLLISRSRPHRATNKEVCTSASAPSQPMKRASAVSCVSGQPWKAAMGGGSGSRGISALLPRQLWRCRMHREKSSNSCDSCDTMHLYEHTCTPKHTLPCSCTEANLHVHYNKKNIDPYTVHPPFVLRAAALHP